MVLVYILEWFNKNHLKRCSSLKSSETSLKDQSPQTLD